MKRLLPLLVVSTMYASASAQEISYVGDTPLPSACDLTTFCTNSKRPYTMEELPLQLVMVGEPPPTLTRAEARSALEQAARTWSDVPCSFARVEVATDVQTIEEVPEFRESPASVAAVFMDPSELTNCTGSNVANIIAYANCFHEGREVIAFNTRDFTWAMTPNFAQQIEDGVTAQPRTVDLPSVATHELGHTLGLSHTNERRDGKLLECALDLPLATMAASYLRDGGQATLAADDRRGLCERYPNGVQTTCEKDADCVASAGAGSTCETLDGISVCQERRASLGEPCSVRSRACDVCFYEDLENGEGFCTERCEDDAGCPQGFLCDTTLTSSGNGICVSETQEPPSGGCCACSMVGGRGQRAPWWGALWVGLIFWRRRSRA